MSLVEKLWVGLGFIGQAMFGARMLIQWVISEKKKASVIPVAFWWLSLGGATILLSYAIYRRDPVFIAGQSFGFIVYIRNLILLRRMKQKERAVTDAPQDAAAAASTK